MQKFLHFSRKNPTWPLSSLSTLQTVQLSQSDKTGLSIDDVAYTSFNRVIFKAGSPSESSVM